MAIVSDVNRIAYHSHLTNWEKGMAFDSINLTKTDFIKGAFDYQDFEVTSGNYKEDAIYECENGHMGAEPALLEDGSSYNPLDGRFEIIGIVVYVCSTCCQPVIEYRE